MAKFILSCGADICAVDSGGECSLFNACRNGYLNIVKALMAVNEYIIYNDMMFGKRIVNAIDFACFYRNDKSADLVEFLIQHGVHISQSMRNYNLIGAPKLQKLIREN
jgi:Ankyrin repeats (3 copies)